MTYYLLSKKAKPVTAEQIKPKKKSWWNRSSKTKVKPVTKKTQDYQAEFYSKTGIIWSGSAEGSVINSLV